MLLGLNLDLIEAISLGHDIGHTPFGHAGESKLSELYNGQTGKYLSAAQTPPSESSALKLLILCNII